MSGTTHNQIILAKMLRRKLTPAENILWAKLRECPGFKFRRQQPIGNYAVDFVCFKANLIIEIDGGQHNEPSTSLKDEQRTKWLESQGFSVLRFWNGDVISNIDGVISKTLDNIQ